MAARADTSVIDTSQVPDTAVRLYHFWDVAHRIRRDPLVIHSSHKAMELVEEEETAFLNLQCVRATTDLGKALQAKAWAIYHGGPELLNTRCELIVPQPFERLLGDFGAADKEHVAADPENEPLCDITYNRRSNALFTLFATKPETIGQAREIYGQRFTSSPTVN